MAAAEVPDWLDAAFVQEALRHGGGADAQACVHALEVKLACAPGDNYCSALFRVRARVGEGEGDGGEQRALLVKAMPPGGPWAEVVKEARLFDREAITFSRVLPAMHALLRDAAPGRFAPFAAHFLREDTKPTPYIVLQDLQPEGFALCDRVKGLDLGQALVAVRALGHMHGASAAVWRRNPQLFDGLDSFFDDSGKELCADYYHTTLDVTANTIETWTDFPGDFPNKVRALKKNVFQKWAEVNRIRPGKLNVLVHGDFWVNNMLYRHEGNEAQEMRFVDFQLSHVGNPAIDLIILHYTSLTEEVFDNHWEALLKAYTTALAETLQALGEEDVPTLEDVRKDLHEARVYTFLAAFVWLATNRCQGRADLDGILEAGEGAKRVHSSPAVHLWLRKLLPILEHDGLFNDVIS